MADIRPFVATRYHHLDGEALGRVLTPPYDVIDPKLQDELYARDPHNLVRIDFGRKLAADTEFENRYTRSGALWQQWKKEGTLVEDQKKCFYVYEQEFTLSNGQTYRRRGFFAAVHLQDFSEGGIRAHEHTFAGPKADRFRLMRATNSNLSPIFCIYDDAQKRIDKVLAARTKGKKPIEATFDGVVNRLWLLSDPAAIKQIQDVMAELTLFIADGHHRYETSLAYRDEMRETLGKKNGEQPYDFTMMYLNNIHDDGMVILPTHRVLSKEACLGVDSTDSLEDIKEYFEVEPLTLDRDDPEAEALRLTGLLAEAGRQSIAFILLLPQGRACLLKLRPDADLNEMIDTEGVALEVKRLDVTILHSYVINKGWLGNPEIELDDEDVQYVKDAADVLRLMNANRQGVGFLLNPTKIEQVCEVAQAGMRMPHKSTFFYPKVITGMVMRDMDTAW